MHGLAASKRWAFVVVEVAAGGGEICDIRL